MADIINLKDRRKRKRREEREQEAAAKRILFGRTRGQKLRDEAVKTADVRQLDGARRDRATRED